MNEETMALHAVTDAVKFVVSGGGIFQEIIKEMVARHFAKLDKANERELLETDPIYRATKTGVPAQCIVLRTNDANELSKSFKGMKFPIKFQRMNEQATMCIYSPDVCGPAVSKTMEQLQIRAIEQARINATQERETRTAAVGQENSVRANAEHNDIVPDERRGADPVGNPIQEKKNLSQQRIKEESENSSVPQAAVPQVPPTLVIKKEKLPGTRITYAMESSAALESFAGKPKKLFKTALAQTEEIASKETSVRPDDIHSLRGKIAEFSKHSGESIVGPVKDDIIQQV